MAEKERRIEEEFKLLRELGQAENEALSRLIVALNSAPDKERKKNSPTDTLKTPTHMKNFFIFLMICLSVPMLVFATDHKVNQELALLVAAKKFAHVSKYGGGYRTLSPVVRMTKTSGDTLAYYVVGFPGRPGFVIVSGSKLVPPVIGTCDKDDFDTARMPPQMKSFLRNWEQTIYRNIRWESKMKSNNQSRFGEQWNYFETVFFEDTDNAGYVTEHIPQLMHTTWGQDFPYNAHCPKFTGAETHSGCGPTAMSQVLRYHEYPDHYDWSQIGESHTEYNPELADLISDCGEAAGTVYLTNGSPTWPRNVDNAMEYVFGFPNARYDDIPNASKGDYEYLIKKSLEDGCPVIIDGYEEYNIYDWHFFVIDGYDGLPNGWQGDFHINWGWYGIADGWYQLANCDPPDDMGPYNYNQGIVHQIRPPAKITMVNPLKGVTVPSCTPIPIAWFSEGRAADMDSAMLIVYQEDYRNGLTNNDHLNYDTIYGIPNQPGQNIYMHQFKSPVVSLNNTGRAIIQIILHGSYGDYARYRFYAEKVELNVSHGEFMAFTSPPQGAIWQANMNHVVSWNYNQNTNPTFLVKYKKVSGPPSASASGQVIAGATNNSVSWLIPPMLEGTYRLEGYKLGTPEIVCYSNTFTVAPLPTMNLTLPLNNQQIQPGSVLSIRWSSNAQENVRIKLQRWDDWNPTDTLILAASTPNDGEFDWPVPLTITPGTLYSVTVQGVINPQITDGVFYFTIKNNITIHSPVAGNEWEKTKKYYITWTDNFTENVDIKLYNGNLFLRNIVLNTPSDGSHYWTVPSDLTAGFNYKIRINKSGESLEAYSDFFAIKELLYINVTAPQANAAWQKGESYQIKWTSNVPNGCKIELLNCSTFPPQVTLIQNFNYSGFLWTVPTTLPAHTQYKIKVTSFQYPDVSGQSEYFSITANPAIHVITPISLTSWPSATNQVIEWSDNLSGNVDILLYKLAGSPSGLIDAIAWNIPSTGSHHWFLPQTLVPGNDYYIIIKSREFTSVQAASSLFTVTQGDFILVNSPAQGVQWQAGTSQSIAWNDNIAENVMIILRKPSIGVSDTIAQSTPSDGQFTWPIPYNTVQATNYNILIRSVTNPNIYDLSSPFEIFNPVGSFITVTSPDTTSVWKMGTQQTITWDDNITGSVWITLLKGNLAAANIGLVNNANSKQITVPTSLTPGTDYRVKVESSPVATVYDYSQYFEIIPADFITYTGPAAFRMNDSTSITWNDNINEHVKIELLHSDTLFSVITPSTESDGSYLWAVPGNLLLQEWYKIRISSVNNPNLFSTSNASHIYFPYFINITNPQAGNIWYRNSLNPVQWQYNMGSGESYSLDLYKGGDSLFRIHWNSGAGYYLWNMYEEVLPGNDYSIKVICNQKPGVFDFSEIFTILDCDSVIFSAGNDTTLYLNGEIDLIATDGFETYFWTPFQGDQRVKHVNGGSFTGPGTQEVYCTATYTEGCIKYDTLILTIAEPPCFADAAFTATSYVGTGFCNEFSFFNTGDSVSGYNYSWDFGDYNTLNTTSLIASHTYNSPGTYTVTCTAYDPLRSNCQDVYQDSVVMHNPLTVGFTYSTSIDTGLFIPYVTEPGNYRFTWWIDGIQAENLIRDTIQADTLRVIFPENKIYNVCLEICDTLLGTCVTTYCQDVFISEIPICRNTTCYFSTKPKYGYGSGNRNIIQITGGVNEKLTNYEVMWNMGDNIPPYNYPYPMEFDYLYIPGQYIISMTVSDMSGCVFTYTDTVSAWPALDPGLPFATTVCDSTNLNANPGYASYLWNDSTTNLTYPVNTSGTYWVTVLDGNGFYKTDTSHVSVMPTVNVTLSPFPVICSDEPGSYFLSEGSPAGGVYEGSYIAGYFFNTGLAGPGIYPVSYYLLNTSECADTATGIIEVEPVFTGNNYLQNQWFAGNYYFTGDTIFSGEEVTNTISPGASVFVQGSNIVLKAENRIFLKPGNWITEGSNFNALIGPLSCLGDQLVQNPVSGEAQKEAEGKVGLTLAPNPTHGKATLTSASESLSGYQLGIYDSKGIRVMENIMISGMQISLDVSPLQPGIYFVRIWNSVDSQTFKMIRE